VVIDANARRVHGVRYAASGVALMRNIAMTG
jgi:hypothetical protein